MFRHSTCRNMFARYLSYNTCVLDTQTMFNRLGTLFAAEVTVAVKRTLSCSSPSVVGGRPDLAVLSGGAIAPARLGRCGVRCSDARFGSLPGSGALRTGQLCAVFKSRSDVATGHQTARRPAGKRP